MFASAAVGVGDVRAVAGRVHRGGTGADGTLALQTMKPKGRAGAGRGGKGRR